ncbi:MAG: hypothetical protein P1S46_03015 [bacterium]|nr:hypothetical protein [bacterium]MDT8395731.1 hypothetical protein [bacterium]
MKTRKKLILTALTVALAAAVVPGSALAGGTWAGTVVDNTALLSWDIGSVAYTTSDTATFVVDELINVQVTNNVLGTNLSVWPGDTFRPLAFDVQNAGNGTIDFYVEALGDGALFVTNVNIWADSNGNGTLDTLVDVNLGAGPITESSVTMDTVYTFFIVADVGASPVTTNTPDTYDLRVMAYRAEAAITADNGAAFNATTIEQVMADTGGTATGFADYDGADSARAVYNLVWANLSLTKSFTVIDTDPMNSGQHAIPGATLRYTLHVLNSGTGAATALSIADATPAGTTFGAVQSASAGTVDNIDPIMWSINSLGGGSSADLVFDVTITGP